MAGIDRLDNYKTCSKPLPVLLGVGHQTPAEDTVQGLGLLDDFLDLGKMTYIGAREGVEQNENDSSAGGIHLHLETRLAIDQSIDNSRNSIDLK